MQVDPAQGLLTETSVPFQQDINTHLLFTFGAHDHDAHGDDARLHERECETGRTVWTFCSLFSVEDGVLTLVIGDSIRRGQRPCQHFFMRWPSRQAMALCPGIFPLDVGEWVW